MKRLGLILLTCLMLALQAVAQAPEKPAPVDLVVTAEIVGYQRQTLWEKKDPREVTLFAKMTVRNIADHSRTIFMMNCDWPNSWIGNGSNGLSHVTFQPGCDKNAPHSFMIPANEAVVFNCPLYLVRGYLIKSGEHNETMCFRFGFVDLDSWDSVSNYNRAEIPEKIRRARGIYWSNILTNELDPIAAKEVTSPSNLTYHLTWEDR